MKGLPIAYIVRSLWVRRVTSLLTAAGMGLVVFVFATVLMMSAGIRAALVASGAPDNVIVLRKGAEAEINSAITRDQARVIAGVLGIAHDAAGQPLQVAESVVLNSLPRRSNAKPGNLTVRGTTAMALALRQQVHLVAGRMFRQGSSELIAGRAAARGFAHLDLGDQVHFAGRDWLVVGVFDSGGSAFDSEVWADAEQVMQAFRRSVYSVVVFGLAERSAFATSRDALDADRRLGVQAIPERTFYAEQSEQLTHFIQFLGLTLSAIFSAGAVTGAMITMFAAVSSRTAEIGTLRALGFRRGAVLASFLGESLVLSLAGGVAGTLGASLLRNFELSTTNFQTLSELAFRFTLTPDIAVFSLLFAIGMGCFGGLLPAWQASRMGIVDCLRGGG